MDPYSCPPATPGIVQQPATPRETGTAIGSQEGTSDLIRYTLIMLSAVYLAN